MIDKLFLDAEVLNDLPEIILIKEKEESNEIIPTIDKIVLNDYGDDKRTTVHILGEMVNKGDRQSLQLETFTENVVLDEEPSWKKRISAIGTQIKRGDFYDGSVSPRGLSPPRSPPTKSYVTSPRKVVPIQSGPPPEIVNSTANNNNMDDESNNSVPEWKLEFEKKRRSVTVEKQEQNPSQNLAPWQKEKENAIKTIKEIANISIPVKNVALKGNLKKVGPKKKKGWKGTVPPKKIPPTKIPQKVGNNNNNDNNDDSIDKSEQRKSTTQTVKKIGYSIKNFMNQFSEEPSPEEFNDEEKRN